MKAECETKTTLLRVAMQLISESSYGSVSVDDICKKADVKKGSFYYFFPSKSDLMVAAMEADWVARQPSLDCVFSSQTPPLERLKRYCDGMLAGQAAKQESCGKVCGCPMITLGAELSTQDEKIRVKALEIMQRYIRYFEAAVRDAVSEGLVETDNPRGVAQEIFAYTQGMMLQAKVSNTLASLEGMLGGIRRLLGLQTGAVVA